MTRTLTLGLVCTVGTLAIAACGEDRGPTQPLAAPDPLPVAAALSPPHNTWSVKAPMPLTLFGVTAGSFTDAAGRTTVYSIGGTAAAEAGGGGILAYDVAMNSWTFKFPFDEAYYTNGVGRIGNLLYFAGGLVAGRGANGEYHWATWAYDPAADTLTRKAHMPRFTAEGVSGVIDNKLWVLPGTCGTEFFPSPGYCNRSEIRLLYRYDPATDRWATRRACPHFHKHAAAAVLDGKFYVAGGLDEHDAPSAQLDVYDPVTDRWSTLAPVPTAGFARGAAFGGRLFTIVGQPSPFQTGPLHAYAYDRATNTWLVRAAPAPGIDALAQLTLAGQPHLLTVAGFHYPSPTSLEVPNDSQLYTR